MVGLANSGEEPGHVPGSLFLGRGLRLDDHDRFPQRTHARDHVRGAWAVLDVERHQHVSCLRHLMIAAHTCGLSKAFPVRGEAARADVVLDGPAKAELIGPTGAAVQHLCDAVALRPECLTQERIIRERA